MSLDSLELVYCLSFQFGIYGYAVEMEKPILYSIPIPISLYN